MPLGFSGFPSSQQLSHLVRGLSIFTDPEEDAQCNGREAGQNLQEEDHGGNYAGLGPADRLEKEKTEADG